MLALGAVALAFGLFGFYEGKPLSSNDGLLARFLLLAFEPRMAAWVADGFCVAFGAAALLYGFLRLRTKI